MEYRKMGRTGLKVSALCLGTMTFGKQVDEQTSLGIIERAIDLGVNFIDTADMYVNGVTEQIVAKAIKGKRDAVVLASKVGHVQKLAAKYGEQKFSGPIDLARPQPFRPWEAGAGTGPNDMGLSRKHLMQAVEASLKRLGTDYLDIYYAHMPDYDTPLDETLRAMDDLVRQGKVRYLGCSNFRAFQLARRSGSATSRTSRAGTSSSRRSTCSRATSSTSSYPSASTKAWASAASARWPPASSPGSTTRASRRSKAPATASATGDISTTSCTGTTRTSTRSSS